MRFGIVFIGALGLSVMLAGSAFGDVLYNNLTPNNLMAVATRPDTPGGPFEIEAGDDFVATSPISITSASFVGLVTGSSPTPQNLVVEIYRVFPLDSDVGRTSGPPTFSTAQVPTRVNSPSDVAFVSRDSSAGELTVSTSVRSSSFTALNSVQPGGIHPMPNQTTGGNGSVTGQEVEYTVTLTSAISLPEGHYFFVPQVGLSNGQFYWLSASRPVSGLDIDGNPTTPFPAGFTDLQAWTRDAMLDPDWLRVGMDIVGGATPPTFNTAFILNGNVVPEPATTFGIVIGLALIGYCRWRLNANRTS